MIPPDTLTRAAQSWLSSFASATESRDAESVAATFLPNGWLRDVMTFSWERRSLEGTKKIRDYLASRLPTVTISNLQLSKEKHFLPATFSAGPVEGVEFGYTYETPIAIGKGFAKVLQDGNGEWKALTASAIMMDLKGYEEKPGRELLEGVTGHASWGEYEAARRAKIESDPYVVISEY